MSVGIGAKPAFDSPVVIPVCLQDGFPWCDAARSDDALEQSEDDPGPMLPRRTRLHPGGPAAAVERRTASC